MSKARKILMAKVALGMLILSAFISFDIPGTDIPVSAQSLAVFLVAYWLRWPLGIIIIGLYLLLGGMGFPVFADGKSGWAVFSGGSGGFLFGFILSAVYITLAIRGKEPLSFIQNSFIFSLATLILLACGNSYLIYLYGFEQGLKYGFWPFWPGAIIKILIATAAIECDKRYFSPPNSPQIT